MSRIGYRYGDERLTAVVRTTCAAATHKSPRATLPVRPLALEEPRDGRA